MRSDDYNRAFEHAKRVASDARRQGYLEAEPAREYCLNGQVGPDKFWTYTASVYLGDRTPRPSLINRIKSAFIRA